MPSPIRQPADAARARADAASGNFTFVDLSPEIEDFETAVLEGLSQPRKQLSCKFFYDETGSKLFEQICELEEYYPTRTEIGILRDNSAEIAGFMADGCNLVEFGSGASTKIRILLDEITDLSAYTAVEISRDHLIACTSALADDYSDLEVIAVCADYTRPFRIPDPSGNPRARRIGFFPGSTIGNFTRSQAREFLAAAGQVLRGGGMLIGADLQKDPAILRAAYNDGKGVTAAFNLNILTHINQELGSDFDLAGFRHEAIYNGKDGRIEMYLVSQRQQTVTIGERRFEFAEGERIHTEHSHKFTIDGFQEMAVEAGFAPRAVWTDADNLFSVHYLEAPAGADDRNSRVFAIR